MPIQGSLLECEPIKDYLERHRAVLAIDAASAEMTPDRISVSSEIDYLNFLTLATTVSKNLRIADDAAPFTTAIEDVIQENATRTFHAEIEAEGPNGKWHDLHAGLVINSVSLHDLLKTSRGELLVKFDLYAGREAAERYEAILVDTSSATTMLVTVNIDHLLWEMRFYWSSLACRFFSAPCFPSLFSNMLTPYMDIFYKLYKI